MKSLIFIKWFAIFSLFAKCIDAITLNISDGAILGGTDRTAEKNETYHYFRGIPYAEPPVGDLRFEPPVVKKPWNGTIDCTTEKSQCIQGSDTVVGSEDCLFVHVYTPSLTNSSPVLVYIHGGAFISGNSTYEENNPQYFLEEGLVFVTFSYRVGVFGFLSTNDKNCPGNMGLKDQRLALAWVKENIAFFGGDPQNITIFGESAGAASVSYHVQSNSSTGLFDRAIMDSGTSLSAWALNRRAEETAFAIGASFLILTTDSRNLISRLKEIDANTLQSRSNDVSLLIMLKNALASIQFGPVKEPDQDEGLFFTGDSEYLFSRGIFNRVPCLIGVNSNEASIVREITVPLRSYVDSYALKTSDLAPVDLTDISTSENLAASIISCLYFNCSIATAASENVVKFVSDDQFNRPTRRAVLDISKFVPVYYYVFGYKGILGGVTNRTLPGVGHSEELGYLFKQNYSDVPASDTLTRKRMVRMWSNFAKFGNPTPSSDALLQNKTWLPVERCHLYYMDISSDLELLQNPFERHMSFYDGIYQIFGVSPFDTY